MSEQLRIPVKITENKIVVQRINSIKFFFKIIFMILLYLNKKNKDHCAENSDWICQLELQLLHGNHSVCRWMTTMPTAS